uniref:CBY1 interacting BAR domain containing 2 n=1 Tax=Oncorhynchus mykiss TaxID=8022 RepID=A0A8C7U1Z5_ONCMY
MLLNRQLTHYRQIKSMELTVSHAEKHLGQFCSLLASYTRKTGKLRDQADMLVRQLNDFSNTDDPELRTCLKNLGEDMAMVQDYRQPEVRERLEIKVVTPLKAYGDIVENKRVSLHTWKRTHCRFHTVIIRQNTDSSLTHTRIIPLLFGFQAEENAQKATNNAHRSTRQLEETISDFQRQKLEDIKRIFTDFITVEMVFHAKALEVYTHTFQNLDSMDIDKDLEVRHTHTFQNLDSMDIDKDLEVRHTHTFQNLDSMDIDKDLESRSSILQRQRGVEEEEEDEEEEDASLHTHVHTHIQIAV